MEILTVNAGSSSIKLSLVADDESILAERELEVPTVEIDSDQLGAVLADGLDRADGIVHRIVHGGERFSGAVLVDDEVESALEALSDLAPLHQPKSVAALRAVSEQLPGIPAVACFDTAFHQTMAPEATTYALPAVWRERWGLRRYGFHGLSHGWIARHLPELTGDPPPSRVVCCHLGAGASLCAIRDGRSVDTTMGFTPLEGLVMATRSGSVDPGMLLWLLEHEQLSPHELADKLEHASGLAGLAGSADMRDVLRGVDDGDPTAKLAIGVYLHRLCGQVASMVAAIGGINALVFTGGIGEHAPVIRAGAAAGLGFLGVALDDERNRSAHGDAEISADGAAVRTFVVRAREDLEMVRLARPLVDTRLSASGSG